MGKISEWFNFDDIGTKIKNLAKWSCWITILLIWIAAPITFIILVSDDWTAYLCWIPLVGAIVGPVFVWIGSWTMYAFGELVEDIHSMRNKECPTEQKTPVIKANTKPNEQPISKTPQTLAKKENVNSQNTPETITKSTDILSKKEKEQEEPLNILPCPQCGEDLSFMGWEDEDLNKTQTCPLCGKEVLLKQ